MLEKYETLPVERGFIRAVIKDLKELRASKMEHELRIQGEIFSDPEASRVIFRIFTKLLTLYTKYTLKPTVNLNII